MVAETLAETETEDYPMWHRRYRLLLVALTVLLLMTAGLLRSPVRKWSSNITATPSPLSSPGATSASLPPSPVPSPLPAATPATAPTVAWNQAIHTLDGGVMGLVTADLLYIRAEPRPDAPIVGSTYYHHPVIILEQLPDWDRIGPDRYVSAEWVVPFISPPPPQTFPGHWVDVNLSQFYAIAYDGPRPVYAAIITAGLDNRTPVGTFQILGRVRNETMDSATIGIPHGRPGSYHLTNVEFTQYFLAGGYALHSNYWTPPDQFGAFGTHGCVGLLKADAAWFWQFLSLTSMVTIHR